jgi:hypothetical protein
MIALKSFKGHMRVGHGWYRLKLIEDRLNKIGIMIRNIC